MALCPSNPRHFGNPEPPGFGNPDLYLLSSVNSSLFPNSPYPILGLLSRIIAPQVLPAFMACQFLLTVVLYISFYFFLFVSFSRKVGPI